MGVTGWGSDWDRGTWDKWLDIHTGETSGIDPTLSKAGMPSHSPSEVWGYTCWQPTPRTPPFRMNFGSESAAFNSRWKATLLAHRPWRGATTGVRLREAHDERPKHAGMPRSVDVGAEKVPFAVHVELVPAPSGIVFPVSLQHSTSPPPSHTLGRQSHCRPHCGYNHAH